MSRVFLAAALALPLCLAAAQDADGPKRSGSVAAAEYLALPTRGFDVRLVPALGPEGTDAELGVRVLDALERDLGDLLDQVPASAHAFLRSVPIFIGSADPVTTCACYHPSARWLSRNGFDPAKAKAVEIANARTYLAWRPGQPSMVLHELSHAWLDHLGSDDRDRVQTALERVRERGVYDRVLRWAGQVDRHYALTNQDEYFAETSEALFGVNDFHPFVRAELIATDPAGAAIIADLWGAPAPRPTMPNTPTNLVERAGEEVRQLHTFFGDWFAGRIEESDESFARFAGALAADFRMVTPDGQLKPRDVVLRGVRGGHGQSPDGTISARIIDVRTIDGIRVLVTYEELQVDGNDRRKLISTALLAQDPNAPSGFVWHHVHETQRDD